MTPCVPTAITDLSVSVDDTLAEVEVRAGRAIVAQLLLRLDGPQQPVDDVVVQDVGDVGGRLLDRRRLDVRPQVSRVPRPAVPYARAPGGPLRNSTAAAATAVRQRQHGQQQRREPADRG